MKLYEITHEIEQLLDAHFDEEGEFIGDDEAFERFAEELDNLQVAHDVKVENLALYIMSLGLEVEAINKERKRLKDRLSVRENKIEDLKRYLTRFMRGSKYKSSRVSIWWMKTSSTGIVDESLIPEEYREPQPDKIRIGDILKDLRADIAVPGCVLNERQSIQIR